MQQNDSNKRNLSQILIYPRFQVKLILANLLILIGVIATIGIQVHRTFDHLKDIGREVGLAQTHPYFEFINYQSNLINSNLAIAFLVSAIISTLVAFYISHRVAGPVVRLIGFFRSLKNGGELNPLTFRKNDYFNELTGEVNSALDTLSAKAKSNE